MKLTKTQATVLKEMKAVIETAKKHDTFESYFKNEVKPIYFEDYIFPENLMNIYKRRYNQALQNIVTKKANTKTFEKLAQLGLIEVLNYGEFRNHDLIKVLN